MVTASPARPRLITIVQMPIIALTVLSARIGPGGRLPTRREMTPSRGEWYEELHSPLVFQFTRGQG